MSFILSDLDAVTGTPEAILLDDLIVPPFTAAVTGKFYWRFEDEPASNYQFLGQQSLGSPLAVPFSAVGRYIRISMIGVSSTGVQSTYDPREGVQTTVFIPPATDNIVVYNDEVVTYNGEVVTYG